MKWMAFIFMCLLNFAYAAEVSEKQDKACATIGLAKEAIIMWQLKAGDKVFRSEKKSNGLQYQEVRNDKHKITGFSQERDEIFVSPSYRIKNDCLSKWIVVEKILHDIKSDKVVDVYINKSVKRYSVSGFYMDGSIALERYSGRSCYGNEYAMLALTFSQFRNIELIEENPNSETNDLKINDEVYNAEHSGTISFFFRNGDVLINEERVNASTLKRQSK